MVRKLLALATAIVLLSGMAVALVRSAPEPTATIRIAGRLVQPQAAEAEETPEPTASPTEEPTPEPTGTPTEEPTPEPTETPTEEPTPEPTETPTEEPTPEPTETPTEEPTPEPTETPTEEPTPEPTETPTEEPTPEPTETPTEEPTPEPTETPTEEPTPEPTPSSEILHLGLIAPGAAHVGDLVHYALTLSTDQGPLGNVSIELALCDDDPQLTGGDDGNGSLDQGESWQYACAHAVDASDADPLNATATASASDESETVQNASATARTDIYHPAIAIDVASNPKSGSPGQALTYVYTVTNTGDTALLGVVVEDDLGTKRGLGTLAPRSSRKVEVSTVFPSKVGPRFNRAFASGKDGLGRSVGTHGDAKIAIVLGNRLTAATGSDVMPLLRTGLRLVLAGIGIMMTAMVMGPRRRRLAPVRGMVTSATTTPTRTAYGDPLRIAPTIVVTSRGRFRRKR